LVSSASFTHTYEIIGGNGSYTWNKQPWAKWITVIAIGGGGGGGGSYTPFVGTTNPFATGGAGGGGGSIVVATFKARIFKIKLQFLLVLVVMVELGRGSMVEVELEQTVYLGIMS
jgi:hypothetical protein